MDELLFKAEKKANAVRKYSNLFGAVSKTLRLIELCAALLLLSWLLTRLPFAVALSAQFLRTLFALAASPLFVFALSNAIIAALLAQSGRFSAAAASDPPPEPHAPPPPPPTEQPRFHDKHVVAELSRSQSEKAPAPPRRRQLCRTASEAEKRREESAEILYPQDKLSNEEFQRAIEAFIAKQLRFLREEESSAIVLQNSS
ncbi:hypothetical protein Fmac_014941 [Flemingia macrophylla]|uniref:Uncharacterized protein n=1 Tax=Flemingia macrophylla TaxID=520843 RepID=A0ABD1MD49_9FABA